MDIVGETESVLQSKKKVSSSISLDDGNADREGLFFLTLYQILIEADMLRSKQAADV